MGGIPSRAIVAEEKFKVERKQGQFLLKQVQTNVQSLAEAVVAGWLRLAAGLTRSPPLSLSLSCWHCPSS